MAELHLNLTVAQELQAASLVIDEIGIGRHLDEPLAALLDAMAVEIRTQGGNPRNDAELAKYARMVPTWLPALATARVILRGDAS